MPAVKIATNFNIDLEFEAAPFYKRLFAWLIDEVLLIIYFYLFVQFMNSLHNIGNTVGTILVIFFILSFLTYPLYCEILMNGQTPGKRMLGLQVINDKGGNPSIGQYIIRWLIRTSDFMVIVILVTVPMELSSGNFDYIWKIGIALGLLLTDIVLANTRRQQRLGDILAHTLLISTREKQSIHDTVFLDVESGYVPSFPQVMQLSDRDINSLKGIIDTARKRNDYYLAATASEKIKTHLGIQTPLSPFDFLDVLLKDYNYLSVN